MEVIGVMDTNGWHPMRTAPKDGRKISAWHKIWKCPVSIIYYGGLSDTQWVECTRTNRWPEESFTHWKEIDKGPETL